MKKEGYNVTIFENKDYGGSVQVKNINGICYPISTIFLYILTSNIVNKLSLKTNVRYARNRSLLGSNINLGNIFQIIIGFFIYLVSSFILYNSNLTIRDFRYWGVNSFIDYILIPIIGKGNIFKLVH